MKRVSCCLLRSKHLIFLFLMLIISQNTVPKSRNLWINFEISKKVILTFISSVKALFKLLWRTLITREISLRVIHYNKFSPEKSFVLGTCIVVETSYTLMGVMAKCLFNIMHNYNFSLRLSCPSISYSFFTFTFHTLNLTIWDLITQLSVGVGGMLHE